MASRKRPTRSTQARKRRKSRKRRLDEAEFYHVLDYFLPWWRPYFVTLAVTGLGLNKLCELQRDNLDHDARAIRLDDSVPIRVRTIYVAEEFWPWVVAAVPVPYSRSWLYDDWHRAADLARLGRIRLDELRQFRARLLAEAEVEVTNRVILHLLSESAEDPSTETVRDLRLREEARQLVEALPELKLTEDEGRRLLIRGMN